MGDYISRLLEVGDQVLSAKAFQGLSKTWGEMNLDLFATDSSSKCRRFVSRYRQPGSWEVDAFSGNWEKWAGGKVAYAFPPVFDALQTVKRALEFPHLRIVLIIPMWSYTGAFQWLLSGDGSHFRPEVQAWHLLTRGRDILPGSSGTPDFLRQPLKGRVDDFIAVLVDTAKDDRNTPCSTRFCYQRYQFRGSSKCRCADKGK